MSLEFAELHNDWEALPAWASFLIKFGFFWPRGANNCRRIALISMPCDSAGAGLVALGALLRDLCSADANDESSHYDYLLRYADQYLNFCHSCEYEHCSPDLKGCGFSGKVNGILKHIRYRGEFNISHETNFAGGELVLEKNGVKEIPNKLGILDWRIVGEVPVIHGSEMDPISKHIYDHFLQSLGIEMSICDENLKTSFSGLSFVGRVMGENESRSLCSGIRFRNSVNTFSLDQLLTIQGWDGYKISRVNFYNARTDCPDRSGTLPRLAVTDGGSAFLKIRNKNIFQNSDIIGVINRCVSREDLVALGESISVNQWHEPDQDTLIDLPPNPLGISVKIIKRRN